MEPICETPWVPNDGTFFGRPPDVGQIGFLNQNTFNLLWQVTQDFIVNGMNEKFSEQYTG